VALLIATAYLAYWGIIGVRTWVLSRALEGGMAGVKSP
jgi:hypothetical protein